MSDIEFTNTSRGLRQPSGAQVTSGWTVRANSGPLVMGSPSVWYFDWPIAFSRSASRSA
jgi:hypothetical protein